MSNKECELDFYLETLTKRVKQLDEREIEIDAHISYIEHLFQELSLRYTFFFHSEGEDPVVIAWKSHVPRPAEREWRLFLTYNDTITQKPEEKLFANCSWQVRIDYGHYIIPFLSAFCDKLSELHFTHKRYYGEIDEDGEEIECTTTK